MYTCMSPGCGFACLCFVLQSNFYVLLTALYMTLIILKMLRKTRQGNTHTTPPKRLFFKDKSAASGGNRTHDTHIPGVCMCTSENAWHCGASMGEKLSVGLNVLKCFYETIHEQIEFLFCGDTEHILYVLLNMYPTCTDAEKL